MTSDRCGRLSIGTVLLTFTAGTMLSACVNRDIQRAHEAVPHQRHDVASSRHQSPPAPKSEPVTTQAPPAMPAQGTEAPAPAAQSPAASATSSPPSAAPQTGLREVFPHIRVDAAKKLVEFDCIVPLNAQDPQKPRQFLEVIVCTPDTKEHEAVLMTRAKPSQVHAALLLIGLEPGLPGLWNWEGETLQTVEPKGPRVKVVAVYQDGGRPREANPSTWVLDAVTNRTLADSDPAGGWLFAGSQVLTRQGGEHYRADVDGTLIGLHTFGGETLAWSRMFNPDSGVEEPRWIANPITLPAYNTPVVVRLSVE